MLYIFDGNTYRTKDLGNATSWDSRAAKIFPHPGDLPENNTVSTDPFRWDGSGLDFEDTAVRLYRSTVGTSYDSDPKFYFRVTAYNQWMETDFNASSAIKVVTMPNATDSQQPSGSCSVTSKEGLKKTFDPNVKVSFSAGDALSGVRRFGLSNNQTTWTWFPFFRAEFADNEEEFLLDDRCTHAVMSESGVSYLRVTDTGGPSASWHGVRRAYNAENIVPGQQYYLKIRYRTGNLTQGSVAVWSHWRDASGNSIAPSDYVLSASASWTEKTFVQTAPSGAAQKHFIIGFHQTNSGAYIDVDWIEFGPGDGSRVLDWTVTVGAGTKTVYLRVEDCVGNAATFADDIALAEDMLPPSVTLSVNGGAESTTSATVTLTLTVQDNASTASQMQMRFSNDGNLWSPWEPFQQTKSWDITNASYGGTSSAGIKKVYAQVCDQAQNVALAVAEIGYNPTPPTGTVSIVGGTSGTWNGRPALFTNSDSPTLSLSYSGASQVRFDPGTGVWGDWEAYAAQKVVYLVKSQGACRLRVQVKDAYGVAAAPQEFVVVVDPLPPTISALRGLNGATATRTSSVTLEVTASDNLPGTLQYRYQVNGGTWSSWANLTGSTISVSGLAAGANQITVQVRDQAGNVAERSVTIFRVA